MTRAIPGRTFLLVALVASTATACTSARSELVRRAGPPLAEPWHAELPDHFRNLTVAVGSGCVLVFGRTPIDAEEPQRLIRCLEPRTGAQRWSRVIDVPRGLIRDKVHATPDAAIYQSGDRAVGLDPSNGAALWTFDPANRKIHAAFALGDRFYLSTDRDTLVTLDPRSGAWIAGHGCDGHVLLGVVRGPLGALAIVRLEDPEPAVVALDLSSPGAREPAPPFRAPREVWRLDPEDVRGFRLVGDVLLAATPHRVWSVDALTGRTLHDEQRAQVAGVSVRPTGLGMRSFPAPESNTDGIEAALLERPRARLPQTQLHFGPTSLVSHAPRTGVLLDMVEIDRWNLGTLERIWRTTRPSTGRVTHVVEMPALGALVIATPRVVTLLDLTTGRLLLERRIDPLRTGWTGIATDGRGLYVLYGNDPAPRLEALPLVTSTSAQ